MKVTDNPLSNFFSAIDLSKLNVNDNIAQMTYYCQSYYISPSNTNKYIIKVNQTNLVPA